MPDEREAFVLAMYDRYADVLGKSCHRHGGYDPQNRELVEDCVQETFVLLFQRYEELKDHPCLGRWLMLTAQHQMDNALYKRRVRERRTAFSLDAVPELSLPDPREGLERWLAREESQAFLGRITALLTPREREVFQDYFLEGQTAEEIARKRGGTLGGVKSILRKIRKKARREKWEGILLVVGILSRFH